MKNKRPFSKSFEHLNGIIKDRAREEAKASRQARRVAYTGVKKQVIDLLEATGGKSTCAVMSREVGIPKSSIEQAVIELGQEEQPFVFHKVNRNNAITDVWLDLDGRS